MFRRIGNYLLLTMIFVASFGAVAYAQGAPSTDDPTISAAVRAVLDAFAAGNHGLAAVLAIVAIVAAVRKWGTPAAPWLGRSPFPELLVLVSAFAATIAGTLQAGGAFVGAVWPAAKLAALAAGGYALIASVGRAVLDRWGSKLPAWLVSVLNVALWLFARPGAQAIARAEAAGAKAVDANHAPGVGDTDKLP